MARGNQRDKAREATQKKEAGMVDLPQNPTLLHNTQDILPSVGQGAFH